MNNATLLAAINKEYTWVSNKKYSRYLQTLHLSESRMDLELVRKLSLLKTLANDKGEGRIPSVTINDQSQRINVYDIPPNLTNDIEKQKISTWANDMARRFIAIETLINDHFKWRVNQLHKARYFELIKTLNDCLPPEVKKALLLIVLTTNKTRLLKNHTSGATAIANKISAFGQLISIITITPTNSLYPSADSTDSTLLIDLQNKYKIALTAADVHTNGVFNDFINKHCLGHPTSYQLLRQYQPPCLDAITSTNTSADNQYQSFNFGQNTQTAKRFV